MIQINHSDYQFRCDTDTACFSFIPALAGAPSIHDAKIRLRIHKAGSRPADILQTWQSVTTQQKSTEGSLWGKSQEIQINFSSVETSLQMQLTFLIPEQIPTLFWKLAVKNQGDEPVWIEQINLLRTGSYGKSGKLEISAYPERDKMAFYSNGWQSWSTTAGYKATQSMQHSRMGPIQDPMVINPGTPNLRQPGYFSSDFFGVLGDLKTRTALLVGFLSQQEHFGTVEAILFDQPSLQLWANGDNTRLDPEKTMQTDWAVCSAISLNQLYPLDNYLHLVAKYHGVKIPTDIPAGWCSWYHFYTNVTAQDIRKNLAAVVKTQDQLPLSLVQIDDGFESQIGDWFTFKPTFPEGVAPLAEEIKQSGCQPGLWLAPFILHPAAQYAKDHPDHLLRNEKGRLARAGFVWNSFTVGLDLTIPEALEYACEVVKTAKENWGYPYLKLDFLYASALKCAYQDPTRTRAQVLRAAMQAIRKSVGEDTFILGCGAPLGSVLGLVEANRIGADVSGSWHPEFNGIAFPFKNEPAMPCARNSIRNILTRAPFHNHWWVNDPDCLLVRTDTKLTIDEVYSLATAIGITGGSVLLSDDLPQLPADRLKIAQSLYPVIGKRAAVLDWIDNPFPQRVRLDLDGPAGEWHLLAWFNPQDNPVIKQFSLDDFQLEPGHYWVRSFWDQQVREFSYDYPLDWGEVPAHGCVLMAVRKNQPGTPIYIGSDFHISQGLEVSFWKADKHSLQFQVALPRHCQGNIDLAMPAAIQSAECDQHPIPWNEIQPGVFRLNINFKKGCRIEITY